MALRLQIFTLFPFIFLILRLFLECRGRLISNSCRILHLLVFHASCTILLLHAFMTFLLLRLLLLAAYVSLLSCHIAAAIRCIGGATSQLLSKHTIQSHPLDYFVYRTRLADVAQLHLLHHVLLEMQ